MSIYAENKCLQKSRIDSNPNIVALMMSQLLFFLGMEIARSEYDNRYVKKEYGRTST